MKKNLVQRQVVNMAVKLYTERENGEVLIISFDVERDALLAKMTVGKYIDAIKKLNPYFTKVYKSDKSQGD